MQHLRKSRKLGRVKNQREALLKTLLGSLIMAEKIETTEAKAKEVKRMIDQIINKVKKTKDADKKVPIIRDLRNRIPVMAIKKLTNGFTDKFSGRASGYVRIIKLSPRKSDSAQIGRAHV